MKRLVLFDIDGTLLHTGGAGTRSMDMAFYELYHIGDAFQDIPMAGKTDMQIMREGLRAHGLPCRQDSIGALTDRYLKNLEKEISNPRKKLHPGIRELLALLKKRGIPLGLLTGNLERGARIKLAPFGLNGYFPDGAFGSDHEDRDMLLPVAIRRFSERGLVLSPGDCIVVGDTPSDVRCAKVHGARSVAVATGPYSREELSASDADVVVDSFQDAEQCARFMAGN